MALSNGRTTTNRDASQIHRVDEASGRECDSLMSKAVHDQPEFVEHAPYLLKWRSSKSFIMLTICLGLFTDSFIYGVLVPVLPFMLKDRCNVDEDDEQLWTSAMFSVFGAAILIGSPICGWYADRSSSRRLPLLLSLPVLSTATVLLGVSTEVGVLLFSRALQGFSTAVVWTVGLALTRDTVPPNEVGQWMGAAISSNSVGLVISPLLGGIVYSSTGLWGVLGMMIGLVCVNILLVLLMIEKRVAQEFLLKTESRISPPSYQTYGTIEHHSEDSSVSGSEPRAMEHYPSFDRPPGTVDHETYTPPHNTLAKSKLPIMLRLMKSPRILTGAYGVFTQFGLLASFDAFLPLFVKRHFHWGSLGAGLVFLNIALPALLGPLAGKISDRFGPRRVALAGCILTSPPLVLLSVIGHDRGEHVVLLCILLVLIGTFLTLIISPLAADLSFAVDQMEADNPGLFGKKGAYAQAYALFNCAMAASCVAGPLVAGGVQDRFGAQTVAWVLGIWCASAAIPVVLFTGNGQKSLDSGFDDQLG